MNRNLVVGFASGLVLSATSSAQPQSRSPVFSVTPYAGYMMFGDHLKGPVGTSLSNTNAALYGAQMSIGLTRNVAVVGNVGFARSNWSVKVPFIGGISVADADVLLYDAGLQFRVPLGTGAVSGVTPILQIGAGAIRYTGEVGPLNTDATNVAFNAGVGLNYQFSRSVGVQLMAKDYVGKFDFKEATGLGLDSKVAHNVALSVGLGIGF